jgi:hypothetical protein
MEDPVPLLRVIERGRHEPDANLQAATILLSTAWRTPGVISVMPWACAACAPTCASSWSLFLLDQVWCPVTCAGAMTRDAHPQGGALVVLVDPDRAAVGHGEGASEI